MSDIPEDVWAAAKAVRKAWLEVDPEGETAVSQAIAMGMMAERKRIADDIFQRNGFMLAISDDGKHCVEISFPTMDEMHGFHSAFVALSQFKTA